jgi:hypothetical protein
MKNSTDTKFSINEKNKDFKRFASKHSNAFIDWEMLHRAHTENWEEVGLDDLLEMISRTEHWYSTFLNNIRIRLMSNNNVI